MRDLRRLIIVPGHGVCRGDAVAPPLARLDASWLGIHAREANLLVAHAESGVRAAAADASALLLFSGGATRVAAGERSEGESYLEVARAAEFWGAPEIAGRAAAEGYARDSFENLLASIARFAAMVSRWPESIAVHGWDFKAERFSLHASALGFAGESFAYVEVNQPMDRAAALAGEARKVAAIADDPMLAGPGFVALRRERDPFGRGLPYRGVDPELDGYLDAVARGDASASPPWRVIGR